MTRRHDEDHRSFTKGFADERSTVVIEAGCFHNAGPKELDMMRNKSIAAAGKRLAVLEYFKEFSAKDLGRLAGLCDEVSVSAGTTILRQGSAGFDWYVIVDGSVDVIVDGEKAATLGMGESFGELAPIDRKPRSATVVATSDVQLLVFGTREFSAALQDVPALRDRILLGMVSRVRDANDRVVAA
jgi:CRP/FNR family transcriptional regulator, cyclic AMP receptor protein